MKSERSYARSHLNFVVMVVEIDVPRPQSIAPDELLVTRRALVLGVARQHALQGHAHALNVLHRAPSLLAQKVETDDAVRVDVGVYRYWSVGLLDEGHLRGLWFNRQSRLLMKRSMPCARFLTDWILVSKPEHQSVNIWVERVVVENLDVQVPRLEVVGGHKRDARREVVGDLSQHFSQLTRFERGGRGRARAEASKGAALRQTRAVRAKTDRHSDTQTYFCQLFPKPPLREVGTHGEVEEKKVVGVGGGGMAPSSGRRPQLLRQGQGL